MRIQLAIAVGLSLLIGLVSGMMLGRPAFLSQPKLTPVSAGWTRYIPDQRLYGYLIDFDIGNASPNYKVNVSGTKWKMGGHDASGFEVVLLAAPGKSAKATITVQDGGLPTTYDWARTVPAIPAKTTPPAVTIQAQPVIDEQLEGADCLFRISAALGQGEDPKSVQAQLLRYNDQGQVIDSSALNWGQSINRLVTRGPKDVRVTYILEGLDQTVPLRPIGKDGKALICPAA